MKKISLIFGLLILVIGFNLNLQAEDNTPCPKRYGVSVGIDFASGINSSFQQFINDQFLVELPNTRQGIIIGLDLFLDDKWTMSIGGSFRATEKSQNDISLKWLQSRASLSLAYAVVDKQILRLSPFIALSFSGNDLNYSNNQSLNGQQDLSDILASSYKSVHLTQLSPLGFEVGLKSDIKFYKSLRFSVYIKWEQSLSNRDWYIQNQKVQNMPKLTSNCLSFGLMLGI